MTSLQEHIQTVGLLKYETCDQVASDSMELEWVAEYLSLLDIAGEDMKRLEALMAFVKEPIVMGEASAPGYDRHHDEVMRRAVASTGAVLEIHNMLCLRHDLKTKICAAQMDEGRAVGGALGAILLNGLLDEARGRLMVSNARRARYATIHRSAILFSLRSLMHTYSKVSWKYPAFVADSGFHAILETACRLRIADAVLLQQFVYHLQGDPTVPSSLLSNVYEAVTQSKWPALAIKSIDAASLLRHLIKSHRLFRRSEGTDFTYATDCITLLFHLSRFIDIGLWPVHGRLAQIKEVGFAIVDLFKSLASASVTNVNEFTSVCCRVLAHMFSRREDLLCSFLVKHATLSILQPAASPSAPFLQVLFSPLSSRPVFQRSVSASLPPT